MQLYGADFFEWLIKFLIVDLCENDFDCKRDYAKEIYEIIQDADLLKYKRRLGTKEKVTFMFFMRLVH